MYLVQPEIDCLSSEEKFQIYFSREKSQNHLEILRIIL